MNYQIEDIRKYYDAKLREYDIDELLSLGISQCNADSMVKVGVPEELDDFIFKSATILLMGMDCI